VKRRVKQSFVVLMSSNRLNLFRIKTGLCVLSIHVPFAHPWVFRRERIGCCLSTVERDFVISLKLSWNNQVCRCQYWS